MSRFDKMLMATVLAGQGEALLRVTSGDKAALPVTCSLFTEESSGGLCTSCSGGGTPTAYAVVEVKADKDVTVKAVCGEDNFLPPGFAVSGKSTCGGIGTAATFEKCGADLAKGGCCTKKSMKVKEITADMCKNLDYSHALVGGNFKEAFLTCLKDSAISDCEAEAPVDGTAFPLVCKSKTQSV